MERNSLFLGISRNVQRKSSIVLQEEVVILLFASSVLGTCDGLAYHPGGVVILWFATCGIIGYFSRQDTMRAFYETKAGNAIPAHYSSYLFVFSAC